MVDLISEIKARADIVQIVSAHVPLKKAGKDYKARCPFHSEKTPSFTVSAEKQLFYCFGCGAGGDLIRFVTLIEKIDTAEAIRRLADRMGIERKHSGRAVRAEPLREALELAARFYEAALRAPVGAAARSYLAKRRMPAELARTFRLGFAPAGPDALTKRILARGVSKKILVDAGLSAPAGLRPEASTGAEDAPAQDLSNLRDRFRDRLIFPILDGSGRVVGFGGRVIREGDKRPKYLNSAENEIFHKGSLLYGYHAARNSASKESPPVLVEGYLDVIYAQSAGLSAMAPLGTSLTDAQSDLLARFRLPVLLAYDSDDAGRRAAMRSMKLLLARDVEVGILKFSGSKDPAELVEQGKSQELLDAAARPASAFEFLVETALALFPNNISGRRQASDLIRDTGSGLRDEILRQELIRAYAGGFGMGPAEAARMLKSGTERADRVEVERVEAEDAGERAVERGMGGGERRRREWLILGALISRDHLMSMAYGQMDEKDFDDPEARMVWDAMAVQYERRHTVDPEEIAEAFADNPTVLDRLTELRLKPIPALYLAAKGFTDLMSRQRLGRLKRRSAEIRAKLQQAASAADRGEVRRLQEEERRLQTEIRAGEAQ